MNSELARAESLIASIADYPQPGILFRDIAPLLADAGALRATTEALVAPFAGSFDVVAGIEARGFILAGAAAITAGVGFVPIRKAGKLPWEVVSVEYALEYGTGTLELHEDAVGDHTVIIVDDLLATGGTARAATDLVKRLGGEVHALAFLIELIALNGRSKLAGERVHTALKY